MTASSRLSRASGALAVGLSLSVLPLITPSAQAQKRPNVVMLMTDDTGWNDFGVYSGGGAGLGHPTPNVDQIANEGATFTNWYGQASCTAGRASFLTGRLPIRSALSIVVAPGDENHLQKQTPTIAEFFQKSGYTTYFSGKWHMGDNPTPTRQSMASMRCGNSQRTMPASMLITIPTSGSIPGSRLTTQNITKI